MPADGLGSAWTRGCFYEGQAVIGACLEQAEEMAREVALEAADRLAQALALAAAPRDVGDRGWIVLAPRDDDRVQRTVQSPVAAAVEAVADNLA